MPACLHSGLYVCPFGRESGNKCNDVLILLFRDNFPTDCEEFARDGLCNKPIIMSGCRKTCQLCSEGQSINTFDKAVFKK